MDEREGIPPAVPDPPEDVPDEEDDCWFYFETDEEE